MHHIRFVKMFINSFSAGALNNKVMLRYFATNTVHYQEICHFSSTLESF